MYDSSEGTIKFWPLYVAFDRRFGSEKVLWRSWLSRPLHIFYHSVSRGRSAVRSRMGLTFCFGLQTVQIAPGATSNLTGPRLGSRKPPRAGKCHLKDGLQIIITDCDARWMGIRSWVKFCCITGTRHSPQGVRQCDNDLMSVFLI
jgi:hypothetical protein